jgi:hypothetical protein
MTATNFDDIPLIVKFSLGGGSIGEQPAISGPAVTASTRIPFVGRLGPKRADKD